jgi:hypothetical protein
LDELFDHGLPHGIAVGIGTIGAAWLQKRDYRMLIDFLKDQFHIVAAGIDGFLLVKESAFTSVDDQAGQIIEYVQENLGGRLCRKHKIGPLLFYYHPFFRTQFSH